MLGIAGGKRLSYLYVPKSEIENQAVVIRDSLMTMRLPLSRVSVFSDIKISDINKEKTLLV